jgi:hypothetical protein
MAMRPFGYNVEKPVGGSDWLADKLTSPNNSLAEIAGRTATGMITPGPEDLLRMMGVVGKAPMQELTVYHGSPHRINNVDEANPVGKFDLSKVGTGEGAQAYGHGIYLAESPDVARSYASDGGSSLLKARMLRDKAKKLRESATSDDLALAERLESQADGIGNGSNFYTVDLPDEHIAKMLDWDAPLSEQPEVLAAIRKAGWGDKVKDGMTGGDFVGKIPNDSRMYLSDDLARVGIPGIKYFDGGSRIGGEAAKIVENYGTVEKAIEVSRKRLSAASIVDRKHWQAIVNELEKPRTRNFVIFDPEVATILSRE